MAAEGVALGLGQQSSETSCGRWLIVSVRTGRAGVLAAIIRQLGLAGQAGAQECIGRQVSSSNSKLTCAREKLRGSRRLGQPAAIFRPSKGRVSAGQPLVKHGAWQWMPQQLLSV